MPSNKYLSLLLVIIFVTQQLVAIVDLVQVRPCGESILSGDFSLLFSVAISSIVIFTRRDKTLGRRAGSRLD